PPVSTLSLHDALPISPPTPASTRSSRPPTSCASPSSCSRTRAPSPASTARTSCRPRSAPAPSGPPWSTGSTAPTPSRCSTPSSRPGRDLTPSDGGAAFTSRPRRCHGEGANVDFFLYSKVGQMLLAVLALLAVVVVLLGGARLADRFAGRSRNFWAAVAFAGPAAVLLGVGLVYPAIRTTIMSFMDRRSENPVGLENYRWIFTDPASLQGFINTFWWVILVPLVSTTVGLIYAILVDNSRFEKVAKSLLFMPMAI